KLTALQSIYETEVLSLQDRWLQLTTKLERGDRLTLERDNVMQAASLVQGELGKLRAKHRDIIVAITRSCVTKIVTAKDIMKDSSNTCDALSKITELQSIYEKEVLPLQDRWLQLTTKLERGDLLTLERDNVMQTESLVQDELEKLRAEHRDIIVAITRSCVRE
ncbi:MAG: hypothetical protein Q8M57_10290, partial [Nitrosomonas sp.]|uniref:hypothetical protein n=1 Tax=Nitrosomonas sp. TaxID=42353 RepID=UPI002734DB6E